MIKGTNFKGCVRFLWEKAGSLNILGSVDLLEFEDWGASQESQEEEASEITDKVRRDCVALVRQVNAEAGNMLLVGGIPKFCLKVRECQAKSTMNSPNVLLKDIVSEVARTLPTIYNHVKSPPEVKTINFPEKRVTLVLRLIDHLELSWGNEKKAQVANYFAKDIGIVLEQHVLDKNVSTGDMQVAIGTCVTEITKILNRTLPGKAQKRRDEAEDADGVPGKRARRTEPAGFRPAASAAEAAEPCESDEDDEDDEDADDATRSKGEIEKMQTWMDDMDLLGEKKGPATEAMRRPVLGFAARADAYKSKVKRQKDQVRDQELQEKAAESKEQKAADVAMTKEQKAEKSKAEKKKKDAQKEQKAHCHREKVDMVKQSLDNHAQLQLVQLAMDSANAALHDETTISQRFATNDGTVSARGYVDDTGKKKDGIGADDVIIFTLAGTVLQRCNQHICGIMPKNFLDSKKSVPYYVKPNSVKFASSSPAWTMQATNDSKQANFDVVWKHVLVMTWDYGFKCDDPEIGQWHPDAREINVEPDDMPVMMSMHVPVPVLMKRKGVAIPENAECIRTRHPVLDGEEEAQDKDSIPGPEAQDEVGGGARECGMDGAGTRPSVGPGSVVSGAVE